MKRANPSRPQANEKEKTMTDTYGPTSGRQFAYYDPDTHSLRMWPATGLWGSIKYSQTVPKTGYMSDGQVYELPTLERPTTGSGSLSSYLPTPTASDWKREDNPADRERKSPSLTVVSIHFPTPSARDGMSGGGQHPAKRRAGGHTVNLTDAVLECTGDNTLPLFGDGGES